MEYATTDDYIKGEYGSELPVVREILSRNLPLHHLMAYFTEDQVERLVYDVVGYYTGCLSADGTPRIYRRRITRIGD